MWCKIIKKKKKNLVWCKIEETGIELEVVVVYSCPNIVPENSPWMCDLLEKEKRSYDFQWDTRPLMKCFSTKKIVKFKKKN